MHMSLTARATLICEMSGEVPIRGEIASRSADENRRAAESLIAPMQEAMEAENPGQAKDLALEIKMIMEALEN